MKIIGILIVMVMVGLCLQSCQLPKIYIGDSSGYATYDRLQHKFEILWESHNAYASEVADSLRQKAGEVK